MKLNAFELTAITSGAAYTRFDEQGWQAIRFTPEQQEAYRLRKEDFYRKTFAPSGVVLRFRTDSPWLRMAGALSPSAGLRTYYSVDITVDGRHVGSIDNFSHLDIGPGYNTLSLPHDSFRGQVDLGAGEKLVCVYLPWSFQCVIRELELADGATLVPVKREKKLLAFGDSITQGYDALRPSHKYITRLADALGMEEYNKGIGGEVFWPELARRKDPILPDLITVAYGTNDWSTRSYADTRRDCLGFFRELRRSYPEVPIAAITPVWRKDTQPERPFGPFSLVEELIRETAADIPNVTVIPGLPLVPPEPTLFGDLRLHPGDEGFRHYFENLLTALEEANLV